MSVFIKVIIYIQERTCHLNKNTSIFTYRKKKKNQHQSLSKSSKNNKEEGTLPDLLGDKVVST
jgi:hypothetical protein